MPMLFDPLRALRELYATPEIGPDGISLTFEGRTSAETRQKALAIVGEWDALLRLQLRHGGASVQKLVAHGKGVVRGGKAVVGKV
jgi:hypothetical protein